MNITMPVAATAPTRSFGAIFAGMVATLAPLAKYIRPMDGVEMTFEAYDNAAAAKPAAR
jgi:hypothetical protein